MSTGKRLWSVSLVVDQGEARLLGRVEVMETMYVDGVESLRIGPSFDEDDLESLRFELRAVDAAEAEGLAQNLAYQGRRAAGLPPLALPVAWVTPSGINTRGNDFFDEAKNLFDAEQFEMAVLAAHVHFETQLKSLLEIAAEQDGPGWAEVLLSSRSAGNLSHKMGRQLIRQLLGVDVTEAAEWAEFRAHIERRNAIAHEGQAIDQESARSSLRVVRALWLSLADSSRATR